MTRTIIVALFLASSSLYAQVPLQIALEDFASGFNSPVDIAHAGDERLFIVEQLGRIRIVNPDGTVVTTPFLNIQTRVQDGGGEQGLLGLAFDPDYANNGYFYVNYTAGAGAGQTRISRFSVSADPNVADDQSEEILYTVTQPFENHNGGDLDFGPDGFLYVGLGDGGSGNDPEDNGQDLREALGAMIRIDVSGELPYTIPDSNPFVGLNNDTLPEVWASGLRNPFRFGFDAETGDLWIGDVGQNQQEEVDFWPAGDNSGPNFGWRCYEGNIPTPGISDDCPPITEFEAPVSMHTHAQGWCSVIGGRVYRGQQFPRLTGRYIYTDYCPTPYFSLIPDGMGGFTRQNILANNGGVGTACIAENSDLELFVSNVQTGTVKRIVDCDVAPEVSIVGEMLMSTEAEAYAWFLNGNQIPNATGQSYSPAANGMYTVRGTFGPCQVLSEPFELLTVGVNELVGSSLVLHPVPARDQLVLSGLPNDAVRLLVTDAAGRRVLEHSVVTGDRLVLDVSGLLPASYLLSVETREGSLAHRRAFSIVR